MKSLVKNSYGQGSDTWHVFENPDKRLKKEISSFKPDNTSVMLGWPEQSWKIVKYNENDVECKSGKNTHFFEKKEIEEALRDKTLDDINKKFDITEHFEKMFGTLSKIVVTPNRIKLSKFDMEQYIDPLRKDFGRSTTGVEMYSNFYHFKTSSGSDEIELKIEGPYGESMCTYFNPEGDIVNRQYNQDFENWVRQDMSAKPLLDRFKQHVLEVGELGRSNSKFFNDKFCYIPRLINDSNICIEVIKHKYEDKYQNRSGDTTHKKPKKLTPTNPQEFLDYVMSLASENFLKKFE